MSEQAKQKVADFGKKGKVKAFLSGAKSVGKEFLKKVVENKMLLGAALGSFSTAFSDKPVQAAGFWLAYLGVVSAIDVVTNRKKPKFKDVTIDFSKVKKSNSR